MLLKRGHRLGATEDGVVWMAFYSKGLAHSELWKHS